MAESNFQFSPWAYALKSYWSSFKKTENHIISQSDIRPADRPAVENGTQGSSVQRESLRPLDAAVKLNPFIGCWAERTNELSLNACGQECIKSPLNRGANTSGTGANLFVKNQ